MAIRFSHRPQGKPAPPGRKTGTSRNLWRRALVPTVVLGVALITVFALLGDVRELADAFRRFDWWLIVPILALTVWNYGWRFLKWQIYLGVLGVRLPTGLSARIFLSGFAMSLTPGKIGELVKAVYVRRATGAPVNRTSAVVAAERITDALALVILATVGATQYRHGRLLLVVLAIGAMTGILGLQRPDVLKRQLHRTEHFPVVGTFVHHGAAFIDASSTIFRPIVSIVAAAAILIRFATLWFTVILGALALIKLQRQEKSFESLRQQLQSP